MVTVVTSSSTQRKYLLLHFPSELQLSFNFDSDYRKLSLQNTKVNVRQFNVAFEL